MRRLNIEEKAALLLTPADNDETIEENYPMTSTRRDSLDNHFPIIAKRSKFRRIANVRLLLYFGLILITFILGCICGVFIILYRISQDAEQRKLLSLISNLLETETNINLSIRNQLFHSIRRINFVNLDR